MFSKPFVVLDCGKKGQGLISHESLDPGAVFGFFGANGFLSHSCTPNAELDGERLRATWLLNLIRKPLDPLVFAYFWFIFYW